MKNKVYIVLLILFSCVLTQLDFRASEGELTLQNIEALANDEYDDDHDPYKHGHLKQTDEKCEVSVEGNTQNGTWYECEWHPDDPACKRMCMTSIAV